MDRIGPRLCPAPFDRQSALRARFPAKNDGAARSQAFCPHPPVDDREPAAHEKGRSRALRGIFGRADQRHQAPRQSHVRARVEGALVTRRRFLAAERDDLAPSRPAPNYFIMKRWFCLLSCLLVIQSVTAQERPAPPSEARQFDFWLGEWEVVTPDGKPAGS